VQDSNIMHSSWAEKIAQKLCTTDPMPVSIACS
jgi:hypothetical protein